MKNAMNILAVFLITAFFASCKQAPTTKQTLADMNKRQEIMKSIANDSAMMTEMMTLIMENNHGKMMMMEKNREMMMDHPEMMHEKMHEMMMNNPEMMKMMMQDMLAMCEKDSSAAKEMSKMISGNHAMMHNMIGTMHKKNMIDSKCYESCKQKMNSDMSKSKP